MSGREPQCAAAVLMVRPARFGFNAETAASNAFQRADGAADEALQTLVLGEFDALADALQRAGVAVIVAADSTWPVKPDAVFPNNWVSFHQDGSVVLYPMLAANRRTERRLDVIQQVADEGSYRITRTIDLSHREAQGRFLEGTGSLVLDRAARVAYAGLSPRTDPDVLGEFARRLEYDIVVFDARDSGGAPVYHTNVVMAVGDRFAIVCGESIADAAHRAAVFSRLESTGHEIVDISLAQMEQFAGNALALAPEQAPLIALSAAAWRSLDAAQRRRLESHGSILTAAIPTIERLGGGSVRCMLAEIPLPKGRHGGTAPDG